MIQNRFGRDPSDRRLRRLSRGPPESKEVHSCSPRDGTNAATFVVNEFYLMLDHSGTEAPAQIQKSATERRELSWGTEQLL
jgi:hypothetical protein